MAKNVEQLEQLTAYLDGELSDAEREKVETLLAHSEDARRLLEELKQASYLLASLPHAPAPEHLSDAITDQLERAALLGEDAGDVLGTSGGNNWFRGLAIAASIALVCTAGWFMWPELRHSVQDDKNIFTLADAKSSQGEIDLDSEGTPPHEMLEQSSQTDSSLASEKQGSPTPGTVGKKEKSKTSPAAPRRAAGMRGGSGSAAEGRPSIPSIVEKHHVDEAITKAKQKDAPERITSDLTRKTDRPTQQSADLAGSAHDGEDASKSPTATARPTLGAPLAATRPTMTNAMMRRITTSSEINRFIMETDDATQKEIALYFKSFVDANSIPDANKVTFPEPIPPTQVFFVANDEQTTKASIDAEEELPRTNEICFVLNAPVDQVKELLHNVNRISASNNAPTNYTANGISITNEDLPASVLGAMMPPAAPSETPKSRRRTKADASVDKSSFDRPTGIASKTAGTDDNRVDDDNDSSMPSASRTTTPPKLTHGGRHNKQPQLALAQEDTTSSKKSPDQDDEQATQPSTNQQERTTDPKQSEQLSIMAPKKGEWVVCTPPHVNKPVYVRLAILLRTVSTKTPSKNADSQTGKVHIATPPPSRPTSRPTTGETPSG